MVEIPPLARELYRVGLQSVPFLLCVGDLVIGWLLLWQAEIACKALDTNASGDDADFYAGKVRIDWNIGGSSSGVSGGGQATDAAAEDEDLGAWAVSDIERDLPPLPRV